MKDADILFQIIQKAGGVSGIGSNELMHLEQIRRMEVETQQKEQLEKEASFGKQFIPV
jgi:hypothetical protein